MEKALQQAILQDTQDNDTTRNRKPKRKRDTLTITSGDIFSARTLESRFVLSHYDQRTANKHTVINVNRNLLRRGRSPFPKKFDKKFSKHKKKKKKQSLNKEGNDNKSERKLLRYQKRKPFYLLQEKTKNLNSGWLRTHLWHAKRCKMELLWGYKLAMRNLQHAAKSMRSTINQLTTCCTLHDASYWNIIALQGKQSGIIQLLLPFIAPFQKDELLKNKNVLNGYNEYQLYIYKKNCYPFDFLCTVKCSWNAIQINQNDTNSDSITDIDDDRVCWLWCHASIYYALYNLLEKLVNGTSIKIRNESRKFVRYELRGPMSNFVLHAASDCFIPNLMEQKSDEFINDGDIMCCKLICDPNHYSVAQPFIFNKKINNKSKTLKFQLKYDFIINNSPCQHPLILINQYKANNFMMNHEFHRYFEQKEDIEMELKTNDNDKKKQKKKIRNPLFIFPFMMIAKRYYDDKKDDKELPLRNKIVGWDIIIPMHSTKLKSFRNKEPSLRFTSIARFWWNNLYFAGGRVIGYQQKVFMRLEMKMNQLLFPIDFMDSMSSIHYWLRYYKLQKLQTYFKKPKSKRINPYPLYPYSFWPNILNLFQHEKVTQNDMELNGDEMSQNIIKIEKYKNQLMNDKKDENEDDDIEMDIDKQLQYLMSYTIWGLKHDCDFMKNIKLNLTKDVIDTFDIDWNGNKYCKYFIFRDKKILQDIKIKRLHHQNIDLKEVCNLDESLLKYALAIVDIEMCTKGVPTVGNPIFLGDDTLFGYVIEGSYSCVKGGGIGIGIVKFNQLFSDRKNDEITISPFWNYPEQRFKCRIQIIT